MLTTHTMHINEFNSLGHLLTKQKLQQQTNKDNNFQRKWSQQLPQK